MKRDAMSVLCVAFRAAFVCWIHSDHSADLRSSADQSARNRSAVRTSLVAGGGKTAGSQRAYSLDSCAMGQTDGRIALFQNAR